MCWFALKLIAGGSLLLADQNLLVAAGSTAASERENCTEPLGVA